MTTTFTRTWPRRQFPANLSEYVAYYLSCGCSLGEILAGVPIYYVAASDGLGSLPWAGRVAPF